MGKHNYGSVLLENQWELNLLFIKNSQGGERDN